MRHTHVPFLNKLAEVNWFIVGCHDAIACLGFAMMISAGNGAFSSVGGAADQRGLPLLLC